jgi:rhomboid family GlyGly-CTERM serine protease
VPAQAYLRRRRALPRLAMLSLSAATLLYLWPEAAAACIYDRAAIARGELWRLLTGHLVHFTALHLFSDGAAFGIAAAAIERSGRPLGRLLFILGAGIGVVLWWCLPQMAFYGGLSGIGYGLFVYAALALPDPRSRWRRPAQIAAAAIVLKVLLETGMKTPRPFIPAQGFVPVPLSHAVGVVIALLFYACERCCPSQIWKNKKHRIPKCANL